jgi:hypothetical protein
MIDYLALVEIHVREESEESEESELSHLIGDLSSHSSLSSQIERHSGWNPVMRCAWQPGWLCVCGASIGGEYDCCLSCGAARATSGLERVSLLTRTDFR